MNELNLNIVSFTVPFPANYGGVIDVYYKLAALHSRGVRIHLHCFVYDRKPAAELEKLCETVTYYQRSQGFQEQLSGLPYIVKSRRSEELLKNLLSNSHPILFEGLHSCYYLDHPALRGRTKIYRESNIEHQYYFHLFLSEKKPVSKLYFLLESLKLQHYQRKLKYASQFWVVSEKDQEYLQRKFPDKRVIYLPSFHGNTALQCKTGSGSYVLYHGNLSVAENIHAAEYLLDEVLPGTNIPFVIAGLNPSERLRAKCEEKKVKLISNPGDQEMVELIRDAQVNILVTFQATGLKLKLLNTLFNGRHTLVNPAMVHGTGLAELCSIAEANVDLRNKMIELFDTPFDTSHFHKRETLLLARYSDSVHAEKICQLLAEG